METNPLSWSPVVTKQQLVQCGADPKHVGTYIDPLNRYLPMAGYAITTPLRLIHLLAQLLHEADKFKTAEEYASGADYEGRVDLGNIHPGDGVRFKGRGLIQCTGRTNYAAYSKKTGIDYLAHPEWLERPDDAVLVSLWYWKTRNLNVYADRDDVLSISQAINQGSVAKPGSKRRLPNGYAARRIYLGKCQAVFMPDAA
ncbi:glycoside hydrolase family 19 protein [Fibrella forsythiae]|uniref:Glycoside hydrolase family 19 catalytic domain-containing protein n=1 Tax=Fibrella forsythiae TaxID=2817061 RepID=A0ABS3JBD8_9BACT|nr:hypothetical protein [Fibrella forsythiae]MBO0947298.1 hypothetical protein [Fibrella forsythiae]